MVTSEALADQPHKYTVAELTALVKTRLKRIEYRPGLLAGFLPSIRESMEQVAYTRAVDTRS